MATKKKLPQGFREKPGRGGLLEYRFRVDGVPRSVYCKTVQEGKEKELQIRKEIAEGAYSKNRNVRLHEYFDEYIAAKRGSVSESTICNNRAVFPRIDKALGKMKVREIETRQVKQFRETLAAEAADDNSTFTTEGVNRVMQLLKGIMQSAVNDGIIVKNPCVGIKGMKRTTEQARDTIHRALTDAELQAFFAAVEVSYYRLLYRFMLNTGARAGECCALTWDDVKQGKDGGYISISKSTTKDENGKIIIGSETKTEAGRRTIPINSTIREILRQQRELTFMLFGSNSNLVFPSARGGLCTPSTITTLIKNACDKAQIEKFSAHAFRDTFASRAVESGMNPETLQRILGHKRISITLDLYYHISPEKKAQEMELISIAI